MHLVVQQNVRRVARAAGLNKVSRDVMEVLNTAVEQLLEQGITFAQEEQASMLVVRHIVGASKRGWHGLSTRADET